MAVKSFIELLRSVMSLPLWIKRQKIILFSLLSALFRMSKYVIRNRRLRGGPSLTRNASGGFGLVWYRELREALVVSDKFSGAMLRTRFDNS